jgi:hypothetical protein
MISGTIGIVHPALARTEGKADFQRSRQMSDADIDDADIPKPGKSYWKSAKLTIARAQGPPDHPSWAASSLLP